MEDWCAQLPLERVLTVARSLFLMGLFKAELLLRLLFLLRDLFHQNVRRCCL